jgi:hypothetical protein
MAVGLSCIHGVSEGLSYEESTTAMVEDVDEWPDVDVELEGALCVGAQGDDVVPLEMGVTEFGEQA